MESILDNTSINPSSSSNSEQLTGEQVWDALVKNVTQLNMINEGSELPEALLILKPVVLILPDLCEDLLEKKFSAETFLQSKYVFIEELINPDGVHVQNTHKSLKKMLLNFMENTHLKDILLSAKEILKDVPAFLKENGIDEMDMLCSEKVGLNNENIEKCRAGTLTVRHVLATQPYVIVNSNS